MVPELSAEDTRRIDVAMEGYRALKRERDEAAAARSTAALPHLTECA